MLCTICNANEVESTKEGIDFCRTCYYTGAAAERHFAALLDALRALDSVAAVGVWHTGGGCFNLAVTLTDLRLLTPSSGSEGGKVYAEAGLPGWDDDDEDARWGIYVAETHEVWEEWDEDRIRIPQRLWKTDELVEAVRAIAANEIDGPTLVALSGREAVA